MNEKKEKVESENWKAEDAREERKERLAQSKDEEGNKKPIKTKNKTGRIISIVLAIVIVIGFVIWFLSSNGFLQTHTKALTVYYDEAAFVNPSDETEETEEAEETKETSEDESAETETETEEKIKGNSIGSVTVSEANIYLGLISQQYLGGGAFSEAGQDTLSGDSLYGSGGTLRDDFLTSVEVQAKTGEYFYWQAIENGYELDDAEKEELDGIIDQYSSMASQSQVTLNHYLSIMFGPGVTENVFRDFFTKNTLANKYYKDVVGSFTYDQAIIDETYEANPDNYNEVDYRSYLFTGIKNSSDSEESEDPDLEQAKKDAEDFLAEVTDEASFKKLATTLTIKDETTDEDSTDTEETDTTLSEGSKKASLSTDLGEWLFSDERSANDTTIIEETSGYRVVLFLDKYKPTDTGSYDSRHILFKIEEDDEEKTDEKMKAKAEEILAEYNAGPKTEESFAELAKEYSDDTGSASDGGLYEDIAVGSFVPEYEEYAIDPARKEGDVEIVKSSYGYHIVYFISSTEEWQASIQKELLYKDEQDYLTKVNNATSIVREKGIKYFGKP